MRLLVTTDPTVILVMVMPCHAMHVYELHFATALINMWTVTFGKQWGALLQFRSGKLLQASRQAVSFFHSFKS